MRYFPRQTTMGFIDFLTHFTFQRSVNTRGRVLETVFVIYVVYGKTKKKAFKGNGNGLLTPPYYFIRFAFHFGNPIFQGQTFKSGKQRSQLWNSKKKNQLQNLIGWYYISYGTITELNGLLAHLTFLIDLWLTLKIKVARVNNRVVYKHTVKTISNLNINSKLYRFKSFIYAFTFSLSCVYR